VRALKIRKPFYHLSKKTNISGSEHHLSLSSWSLLMDLVTCHTAPNCMYATDNPTFTSPQWNFWVLVRQFLTIYIQPPRSPSLSNSIISFINSRTPSTLTIWPFNCKDSCDSQFLKCSSLWRIIPSVKPNKQFSYLHCSQTFTFAYTPTIKAASPSCRGKISWSSRCSMRCPSTTISKLCQKNENSRFASISEGYFQDLSNPKNTCY